jgi:hypothetical protein
MGKEKYTKINDGLCTQIHFNVRKKVLAKLDDEQWYEHIPKPVETSHEYKVPVLWNQQVKTDRTRHNNKPDIMYRGSDI